MYTASLDNCKRLFELSGWDETYLVYYYKQDLTAFDADEWLIVPKRKVHQDCTPAYDLGYLLQKLPRKIKSINSREREGNFNLYASRGKTAWIASYADADCSIIRRKKQDAESNNHRNFWWVQTSTDTPTDAACLLAIKLFEEGVLK